MQRLEIEHFGPVDSCNITIEDFMIFTGAQASGKSTIAKCIFYFHHLKTVLFQVIQRRWGGLESFTDWNLKEAFLREARNVFVQSFGIEEKLLHSGKIVFQYDNGMIIEIRIQKIETENDVSIEILLDHHILALLEKLSENIEAKTKNVQSIRDFIEQSVFGCDFDAVYIPAGRSLLTMMAPQIQYIYAVMDDQQKRMIDYCTQCYLEEVLKLKDFFQSSPKLLVRKMENTVDYPIDRQRVENAADLMQKILGGEYRSISGQERFYYSEEHSVRLNYASSGQQEAVWITNILFYYMLGRRKAFFIIEEPESHLFPETQRLMAEFISLVKNGKHKVIITTHSPYILASINNLLYANRISKNVSRNELNRVIPENRWLDFNNLGAYYLEDGCLTDITDPEFEDLNHDVIDGVSSEINDIYESMVQLKERSETGDSKCC